MGKFSNTLVWQAELIDKGFSVQDALRTVSRSTLADPRFITTTSIDHTDSPYTAGEDDIIIFADASTSPVTVNLPQGIDRRLYFVKNTATTGSNLVTVNAYNAGDGTETIDGANFTTLQAATKDTVMTAFDNATSDWKVL